jgi:XTP/dITP diphosphohydrolase
LQENNTFGKIKRSEIYKKMSLELLIATTNAGKIKELQQHLANLPIVLRNTSEFPNLEEPEETGLTLAENAVLKARYYARETGILSLADDSGLEVEALDGRPGVFSARYAGAGATNEEKIAKLLFELAQTKDGKRLARFVCSVAISDNLGEVKFLTDGICSGRIAKKPVGNMGFGYDPIFIPDGYAETFGELPDSIKQEISHRGRAISKINEFLLAFRAS